MCMGKGPKETGWAFIGPGLIYISETYFNNSSGTQHSSATEHFCGVYVLNTGIVKICGEERCWVVNGGDPKNNKK